MRKHLLLMCILVVLLTLYCSKKEKDTSYIVKIGKNIVLEKEHLSYYLKWERKSEKDKIVDTKSLMEYIETNLKENLLFEAEGYRIGLDKDKDVLEKIEEAKRKIIMGTDGVMYKRIISRNKNRVSDEEVKDAYKRQNVEIKIAQISVNTKEQADSVYHMLKGGVDFAGLAIKFSIDERTRDQGGDTDIYYKSGDMPNEVEKAAFGLQVGEFHEPVQSHLGYHIIKLLDKRNREQRPLEKEYIALYNRLIRNKTSTLLQNYTNDLRRKYELEINLSVADLLLKAKSGSEKNARVILDKSLLTQKELDQIFVQYKGGQWTVGDFIDKYLIAPQGRGNELERSVDVINFAYKVMTAELMWLDALEMGLDKDPSIQTDLQRMEREVVGKECKKRLIDEKSQVTDEEVKAKFEAEKIKYEKKEFDKVAGIIRSELYAKKKRNIFDDTRKELEKRHKIIYNKPAIQEFLQEISTQKK